VKHLLLLKFNSLLLRVTLDVRYLLAPFFPSNFPPFKFKRIKNDKHRGASFSLSNMTSSGGKGATSEAFCPNKGTMVVKSPLIRPLFLALGKASLDSHDFKKNLHLKKN